MFFSFQSAFLATEIQTLLHLPKDIYNTKTSRDGQVSTQLSSLVNIYEYVFIINAKIDINTLDNLDLELAHNAAKML